ncbi:hypothetical protein JDV02_008510 [Purpureocillium takamizusanense]|uniref:Uncharacterized protein n=1 Tax=Purpureocillium takamizusanense TaxID=2060973 RepID=A0A9Q8QQH4_9HYPO|nr:uncharacterized protein JDV02_008510 [Purpureocillium takamizusanense]UNI22642.1 hypothetical protein JDV02_008510 [Purpureocillium takamizusanense]
MTTIHGAISGLQMNLNNISQEMNSRNKTFEDAQVSNGKAQEQLRKRLDTSQSDLVTMRQQIENLINEWIKQSQSNNNPSGSEMNIKNEFNERGDTINLLEREFHAFAETASSNMAALAEKAFNNEKNAHAEIRDAITSFKRSLEKGFKVAQDESEKCLRHTQTAMAAFGGQLRAVSDQVEARFCASEDKTANSTSQLAGHELTPSLQERIRDLEGQLRAAASLRERWQHDIRKVDMLKSQLRSIEDRVPQVQDVGITVERIAEVNRLLHSTARYLAEERLWVQKHRDHVDAHSNTGTAVQVVDQPSQMTSDSGDGSLIPNIGTSLILGDVPCLEVPLTRKVPMEHSSVARPIALAAPSVEQEQIRRREGAKPRPILKVSSSQESSELGAYRGVEIVCRRDGRVSFGETGTPSTATEEVVRGIRRGLLSAESVDSVCSLPTVATFERDHSMLDKRCVTKTGNKHGLDGPEEIPGLTKKLKVVSDLTTPDIDASLT